MANINEFRIVITACVYNVAQYLEKNINKLFIGTGLFLIISNWVFMGFYFTVDTKTIIIGFLISYKELYLKSNKILDK